MASSAFASRVALLATIVVVVGGAQVGAASLANAVEEVCSATTPIFVCLEDPGPFTGILAVRARVEGVPLTDVERVIFSTGGTATSNGTLALGDHFPDADGRYSMRFDTRRFPNASLRLKARAELKNGSTVGLAQIVRTVSNSTSVPVTPLFVPHTPTASGDRFRLAAVGDGVNGSPESEQVVDLIADGSTDALAYLGDVYDRGTFQEFDTHYSTEAEPNGWGRLTNITNPTIGNHEYMTPNTTGQPYWDFWGMKTERPGSTLLDPRHYYSYDVGDWHVVVLDSTTDYGELTAPPEVPDTADDDYQFQPGSAQYDWLAEDLAEHAAEHPGGCTLAYMHHALFTNVLHEGGDTGFIGREGMRPIWNLLSSQGVSVVVNGHAHNYERWAPTDAPQDMTTPPQPAVEGMTEFVVGSGGRAREGEFVPGVPGVEETHQDSGALFLDLGAEDANFEFRSIDGVYTDSGTIPCRTAPDIASTVAPADPDGLDDWYVNEVTLHWGVTEPESPDSLATDGCEDVEITADQPLTTYTCTATSNGGSREKSVQIKVDLTNPTVTCAPAPTYQLNHAGATVSATVEDNGSGATNGTETVTVPTSTVGMHHATVTGTDKAGRTTSTECDYQVVYDFHGFTAPVDNPDAVNLVRAGQIVPVKWRLTDDTGAAVTDLSLADITTVAHACGGGTEESPVEELPIGASGLQNLGDGYYQVNWKSQAGYAGTCRTMRLDLGEARFHLAEFQFT